MDKTEYKKRLKNKNNIRQKFLRVENNAENKWKNEN